jgi:hypothetical protein
MVHARIVYVDGHRGTDQNDGLAPNRPVATIQQGAKIVQGGDLMIVRAGVYYETPVFDNLGSSLSKPVWILAQPRDSVTISGMWQEAATGKVHWKSEGQGVYSAPHGPALFGAYQNAFLYRLISVSDLHQAYASKVKVQMPPHGFAVENNRIYVRLPGNLNPNGQAVLFSSPTWGEPGRQAVVRISRSPYVILDGFRIVGSGTYCTQFSRDSHHAMVRNTVFSYCRYGVQLPDHSLIEWSEYTYPGFRDFSEQLRLLNGGWFRTFELVKKYHPAWLEGGLATTYGKDHASQHCEFRYNFLHETFDGESLGDFEDSQSHHNVYLYNYDNHIEMENWAGHGSRNLRLHHSLFLACPQGPISHQEKSIVGPHYVYRNVIYGWDDHGWPAWTLIKSKTPNAEAGIFYYHNLLWGAKTELFWDEAPRHNLHFRNNILIFIRNRNRQRGSLDSDYNLLVNPTQQPWLYGPHGKHLGTDPAALQFLDVAQLNFGIQAGSPAQNVGMALPGFNDHAIDSPDVGPFEVGEPSGPNWPRPRKTTFTSEPPPGWNGPLPPPEDTRSLTHKEPSLLQRLLNGLGR